MSWEEDASKFGSDKSFLFASYEAEAIKILGADHVARISDDEIHVKQADGGTSRIFLTNLWAMCRNHPEESKTHFRKFLTLVTDLTKPKSATRKECVVPQVRSQELVDCFEGQGVTTHLAGDLWKVFAEDLGDSLSFLVQTQVTELGMTQEELDALAMGNLYDALPSVNISYGDHFAELNTDRGITSGALFLSTLWEDQFKDDARLLFATLPSTGSLLFCRGVENLDALRNATKEIFEGADHPISQTVLRWVDGTWQAFSA